MGKVICHKCNKLVDEEEDCIIVCDGCAKVLHEACGEITSSEGRVMQLKKRTMFFFCCECKTAFKNIPNLIKSLKEALEETKIMREENKTIRDELKIIKKENEELFKKLDEKKEEINVDFKMVQEIEERMSRSSNIIVTNIQESKAKNHNDRAKEDTENIKKILQPIISNINIKRTFRLGKFNNGKQRLLKVVLNDKEDVKTILKNKTKINIPGMKFFSDQTKMQRDYFNKIKQQVNEMVAQGENKSIRYVGGIPTIVDAVQSKN